MPYTLVLLYELVESLRLTRNSRSRTVTSAAHKSGSATVLTYVMYNFDINIDRNTNKYCENIVKKDRMAIWYELTLVEDDVDVVELTA